MEVTELGMVTEVSPEQPEKAPSPMEVTELGMVTEVSPEQLENADSPIEVTELGIMVFWQPIIRLFVDVFTIALQLLRESYVLLLDSTAIFSSTPNWDKSSPEIDVTLSPITSVNILQPSNTYEPIVESLILQLSLSDLSP